MISIIVPPSEVIDKLSILQIKREYVTAEQRTEIDAAIQALTESWLQRGIKSDAVLDALTEKLMDCNCQIWLSEDMMRCPDATDHQLLSAMRQSRDGNDERARTKRLIDQHLNAEFSEVKTHG